MSRVFCIVSRGKLARTKTRQSTDKASKHNGRKLFSRVYQQLASISSFILCHLVILLPLLFSAIFRYRTPLIPGGRRSVHNWAGNVIIVQSFVFFCPLFDTEPPPPTTALPEDEYVIVAPTCPPLPPAKAYLPPLTLAIHCHRPPPPPTPSMMNRQSRPIQ